MTGTLYLDESKAKRYTVVAALVASDDLQTYRRAVEQLRLPGQRRLHFARESPPRRRLILSALSRLGVEARAYRCDARTDAVARTACLSAVVGDLAETGGSRLVLEQDDSIVEFDRQLLYRLTRSTAAVRPVTYEHVRTVSEPLLAIPDALAWCISRGGEWRHRADAMLTSVQTVTG